MGKSKGGLVRRVAFLAVALVGVAAIGGTALAGHQTSGVKSYTGCLVSGEGVLIKIKEGSSPRSACAGGQVEAHFSGGDITKISVTGALAMPGGGTSDDNGEVTIGLKPEFTLPQNCTAGRVAKWNGSAWVCGVDDDTTYAPGTGLILTPAGPQDLDDAFSIHPDYRVKNTPDCSSGQFATGFEDNGTIKCAAPPTPSMRTFTAAQANFSLGDGVPDDGARHTYVTRSLPTGSYVVLGKGALTRGDDDIGFQSSEGAFGCGVSVGSQTIDQTLFTARDNEEGESYGFSLAGVVATQGAELILWCDAENDADQVTVRNARLVALQIG